jgi:CBS domain containing-hemolysin-like protein
MSTPDILLRLASGAVLVLANAFFVATEFALTRARQFDEEDYEHHPGLRRAWEMTERLEIYLTGCQLGITTSSILLGITAEPAVTALLEPLFGAFLSGGAMHTVSIVVGVVIINLIHKIWGEQAPTYFGVEQPRRVAQYGAPMLYWWVKITYPFIKLGDGLAKQTLKLFDVEMTRSWTEAELEDGGDGAEERTSGPVTERLTSISDTRHEMGRVLNESDLSRERRVEVLRALEIDRMTVREIMVPREDVVALTTRTTLEDNIGWMREHPFDRYPLVGESWDDPLGIVYLMEVFQHFDELEAGKMTLEDLARAPPMMVPSETAVSDLIDRFQEAAHEQAFVIDAHGNVMGLATTTDAFEVIAGDLKDPVDLEQEHRRRAETQHV